LAVERRQADILQLVRALIDGSQSPAGPVRDRWLWILLGLSEELSDVAQKAACHNTGWPMAVVLTKPELAPKPLKDGIRAVIHSTFHEMFDYWWLQRNGRCFLLRTLAEDSIGQGKNKVFFEVRIWESAEALLHCARLYKELQVAPDAEINIAITHVGLLGRLLSAGDGG
jgi:hypothetical protein